MSNEESTSGPSVELDTAEEQSTRLDLAVEVASPSACERHITVTIGRDDIERQFDRSISEMMPSAQVPGFRAGRAPRKLVESRYRKDLADQVKSQLLLASLEQIQEDQKLAPISEPDFDPSAITLPDEGPMTFEFNIEVRPEFDLPDWKGLKLRRPTREFTDEDVERQLRELLADRGHLEPHDGPAELGDYLVAKIVSTHGGEELFQAEEVLLQVLPVLSFQDGRLEEFDKYAVGATAGDKFTLPLTLSLGSANEALRGQTVDVSFEVLEVKRLALPELTPELLSQLGDFDSPEALRQTVRESLVRRLEYQQQREAREQILSRLVVAADWDLPPALLKRQSQREFERAVLEMQRSGFSGAELRSFANELRQNSEASTARALKEHFILERIAEELSIDAEPDDYDVEVRLIAMQTGDSPRRVRAQLEKRGLMDSLRNQIVERKTIDAILAEAAFEDVAYELPLTRTSAVQLAVGGAEAETQADESMAAE